MNFLCERCGTKYEIDFRSFTPECPRCGSGAAQLQMTPNGRIDHVDDDNLCHRDTSEADRGLRDLPVSDVLLFLGALWLITNDFE